MKKVKLSQGKYALVDDEDYALVMLFDWEYIPLVNGYAKSSQNICDKNYQIYMHRIIMNAPGGLEVDHLNTMGLDNRKKNLRLCTHAQNLMNQVPQRRKTSSKYKGVWLNKISGRWHAHIKIHQKKLHIGCYKKEMDAARSYNKMALELFGEFAHINKFEQENERIS